MLNLDCFATPHRYPYHIRTPQRHNNLLVASTEQVPPLFLQPPKLWGFLMETFKNTAQGAATQTLMVVDPAFVPGEWYVDCNVTDQYLHPTAKDPETGKRLWNVTEEMIKPYL